MINPNDYFYSIEKEHFVCNNKQTELYQKIINNNNTVLQLYKQILEIITLIDREYHSNNRELDSKINEVYIKLKEEVDAMATSNL